MSREKSGGVRAGPSSLTGSLSFSGLYFDLLSASKGGKCGWLGGHAHGIPGAARYGANGALSWLCVISIEAILAGEGSGGSMDLGRNSGIDVVGKGEGEVGEAEEGVVESDHASWDFLLGIPMVGL